MNNPEQKALYRLALGLSIFTIIYNIIEGVISVYFGVEEDALTLFGFGVDSFIEAISGLGIAHMVIRVQRNPGDNVDRFEKTALRITGTAFYLLCLGLAAGVVIRLINKDEPVSTLPGVIISSISILIMWALVILKTRTGKKLNSASMLADASCTRVCIYMSLVLLASSAIYELTKINYIDVLGTVGIIYFCYREGKEAFEKAEGKHDCHCHTH